MGFIVLEMRIKNKNLAPSFLKGSKISRQESNVIFGRQKCIEAKKNHGEYFEKLVCDIFLKMCAVL